MRILPVEQTKRAIGPHDHVLRMQIAVHEHRGLGCPRDRLDQEKHLLDISRSSISSLAIPRRQSIVQLAQSLREIERGQVRCRDLPQSLEQIAHGSAALAAKEPVGFETAAGDERHEHRAVPSVVFEHLGRKTMLRCELLRSDLDLGRHAERTADLGARPYSAHEFAAGVANELQPIEPAALHFRPYPRGCGDEP